MATVDHKQTSTPAKPASKKNFSNYLRAIETERFSPANNADKPLTRRNRPYAADDVFNARLLQATGMLVSAIWLVGAGVYIQRTIGWTHVSALKPHEMGGFLAGILSPVALFWMIAAFIMRSNDVKKYAEALRAEIQEMIFPSEEADRRVNNDIERLMRQTAEMSRATRMALGAIESAREGLRSQVNGLNDSSEMTVDRLEALSQALSARMMDAAEMEQKLGVTIHSLEQRAGSAVDKMSSERVQLEGTIQKIAETGETTELSVARLSEMLRTRLESLGGLHQETETALQKAAEEMATQRRELRIEAEGIEEKAYQITDALKTSTDRLYEFSDDALDKAKLIETKLQGHTASLQHVLTQAGSNTEALENAITDAVAKLRSTTDYSVEGTQKIESILRQAIDRLEERTKTNVTEVQQSMGHATDALVNEIDRLEERAKTNIIEVQKNMGQATDALVNEIDRLEQRTKTNITEVRQSMSHATDTLVSEIDQISERAKVMTDTMLAEVNRKVMDTTSAFAYIQKQIQSLVKLFDQRKLHLDEASVSARQTAEAMSGTLQLALDKVAETSTALQKGVGTIHVSLQQPIALLENVANLAFQRADDIGKLLENKATHLTDTAEKMGEHVTHIQSQLTNKGQDVALIAGKIAGYLKSVTQELEQQNNLLDDCLDKSVTTIDTMQQANRKVVDNLGLLREQTLQTSDQSSLSADTIQQRVTLLQQLQKALANDSEEAGSKISTVSDRMANASTHTAETLKQSINTMSMLEDGYHKMLQDIRQETGQTQQVVTDNLGMLQAATQNIIEAGNTIQTQTVRIQEMGQSAQETLQGAISLSRDVDTRLTDNSQTVTIHISAIQEAVTRMQNQTLHAVEALTQQEENLEQKIQSQVAKISEAGTYFITASQKIRADIDDVAQATETTTEKMRQTLDNTQSHLGQSVSSLMGYADQINDRTTYLLDQINRANSNLVRQNHAMHASNDDALANLQQASSLISENANALELAAKAAKEQAEILRQQEAKLNRESFFNSAKFVVESLHSLALDFTRMLDGELNDKAWRAYQKGDVAAFTRRLLSARDEETQGKIEAKFKEDVEFRTYVQRYLRQFEEICDSAAESDHADLLTSIFTTSDVGKLYQFLCMSLDRESRLKKAI